MAAASYSARASARAATRAWWALDLGREKVAEGMMLLVMKNLLW